MTGERETGSDAQREGLRGSSREEALLGQWLGSRDARAAKQLVESHLPVVASIASQYWKFGVPMQELVNAGTRGLYQALRRYQFNRCSFSAYVAYWAEVYIWTCIVKKRVPSATALAALLLQQTENTGNRTDLCTRR